MSCNLILSLFGAKQQIILTAGFTDYFLAFCRIALGLVFLFSSVGKIRHVRTFVQTIQSFRLLPASLDTPAAVLFLGGEGIVVVCLGIGNSFLLPGFGLALLLLLIFSSALASVIARNIPTSCNCFGTSEKEITRTDLWRNAGLILCALGGCADLSWEGGAQETLSLAAWVMTGLAALAFVIVWLQLQEIVSLFHQG